MAERDRRREELANAYRADQVLQQRQEAVEQEIAETQRQTKQRSAPGTIHVDMLLNTHRYELILTRPTAADSAPAAGDRRRRSNDAARHWWRRTANCASSRNCGRNTPATLSTTQQKAEIRLIGRNGLAAQERPPGD